MKQQPNNQIAPISGFVIRTVLANEIAEQACNDGKGFQTSFKLMNFKRKIETTARHAGLVSASLLV